ncbi:MAG: hypothetical protein NT051_01645 [Candidatus Micrarchaeota archaeon]|nr:hypothetical protein [Candidatus Micrarchaeota archaeon]
MKAGRFILASIAYAAIAQIIHTLGAFLSMSYYTDPSYFPVWSSLMMPAPGPPGAEFYLFSIIFGLILGAIFTYAYQYIRPALTVAKRKFRKPTHIGLRFGLLLFLICSIPALLSNYLLLSLPLGLLLSWQAEGLAIFLLFGLAVERIIE